MENSENLGDSNCVEIKDAVFPRGYPPVVAFAVWPFLHDAKVEGKSNHSVGLFINEDV